MGTPLYSSPEIIADNQFSKKSDIWAMGVTLYLLCNLKLPFMEKSYRRLIEAIQKKIPEPINDMYSLEMREIINKMLLKDPKKRISMEEIFSNEWIKKQIKIYNTTKQNMPLTPTKSNNFDCMSPKSLKSDFDNCRVYKNSNFINKEDLEKLKKDNYLPSDSNSMISNESLLLEDDNEKQINLEMKEEDMVWLRERMSMAGGSIKIPVNNLIKQHLLDQGSGSSSYRYSRLFMS